MSHSSGPQIIALLWPAKQTNFKHVTTLPSSIRVSTWNRLNYLKNGVLKSAFKSAMAHDPISPVLSDAHLDALEQRLRSVLATVKQCTDQFGLDTVLVEDRMPLSHL